MVTFSLEFEINAQIRKTNEFLDKNESLFNSKYWDKVFNEFTIFDDRDNELRIDRLQINETDKKILIIDYKTGFSHQQQQLDEYTAIIDKLPFVKENLYKVSAKFMVIDMNKEQE